MRTSVWWAFALLCVSLIAGCRFVPTVLTVGPNGDFRSIQDALDASIAGDEIVVLQGVYFEHIRIEHEVFLRSVDPKDEDIVATTIIDGANDYGYVVSLDDTVGEKCIVTGFTIQHGWESWVTPNVYFSGGGVNAAFSQARIVGNTIRDNDGAGIEGSDGYVGMNRIVSNNVGIVACTGEMSGNFVAYNSGDGGIKDCPGDIINNIIVFNYADVGFLSHGYIYSAAREAGGITHCTGDIFNNTLYANRASPPDIFYELYGSGALTDYAADEIIDCTGRIVNCIIWHGTVEGGNSEDSLVDDMMDSTVPIFSCIEEDPLGGEGNISIDPKFLDPTNEDFRLLAESPCLDTGTSSGAPHFDIEITSRPQGAGVDMGAYEMTLSP